MVIPSLPLQASVPASSRPPPSAAAATPRRDSGSRPSPPLPPPVPPDGDGGGHHHEGHHSTQTLIQMLRMELDYSWQVAHFALIEHRAKQEQILSRVEAYGGKIHHSPVHSKEEHHSKREDPEKVPVQKLEEESQGHGQKEERRHPDEEYMSYGNSDATEFTKRPYISRANTGKSIKSIAEAIVTKTIRNKKFETDKPMIVRDIEEMLEDLELHERMQMDENIHESWSLRQAHWASNHAHRKILLWAKWFFSVEEPERVGPLAAFSRSWGWHAIVNFMIMANSIFMVYTADYNMHNIASDATLPMAARVVDMIFFGFFFVEVTLRIVVHRLYFFINKDMSWNFFDLFLTLFSIFDAILSWTTEDDPGLNVIFLRSFRILRIARTLRVIRILRFAAQLRRMLQSVIGSLVSLVWAFVMLFFVFFIAGIALVQSLSSSLMASDTINLSPEDTEKLFDLFGSVYEASLSFYIASCGGAAWNNYFRLLQEVSSFSAVLFIVVIGFVQFALLNILTGIFVENAMKVAKPDREARALEQRRAEIKDITEFRACLKELDVDCSNSITLDEFQLLKNDPRAHAMFSAIGLDIKDAELFFNMVCKSCKTSEVDFEFLIDACMKMKGYATSLDANAIMYRLQLLDLKVATVGAQVARQERSHSHNEEQENKPAGLLSALALR